MLIPRLCAYLPCLIGGAQDGLTSEEGFARTSSLLSRITAVVKRAEAIPGEEEGLAVYARHYFGMQLTVCFSHSPAPLRVGESVTPHGAEHSYLAS